MCGIRSGMHSELLEIYCMIAADLNILQRLFA